MSALLLVAFGAGFGHLASVEHGVCEHGELTHVHHDAIAADARAAGDHEDRASNGATAREDAHEHCSVLAAHHRLPTIAPHVASATLLTLLPPPAPPSVDEQAPRDPLALAPKNSPPRG